MIPELRLPRLSPGGSGLSKTRRHKAPAARRAPADRSSLQSRGVVGPHDDLPALDDLPVPGQDDEIVGLKGMKVRRVVSGLERNRAPHLGRLESSNLAQGELHRAPGITGLIHYQ